MSIRWNGRNFEDALNKAVFTEVRDNVASKLRRARCAVHGQTPTSVSVTGRDLKSLEWRVSGCCEDGLTAAARKALN